MLRTGTTYSTEKEKYQEDVGKYNSHVSREIFFDEYVSYKLLLIIFLYTYILTIHVPNTCDYYERFL